MSTSYPLNFDTLSISGDTMKVQPDDPRTVRAFDKFKAYAASIPYSIEPNSQMQNLLDFYLMRMVQVGHRDCQFWYIGSCLPSVLKPRITNPVFCSGTA